MSQAKKALTAYEKGQLGSLTPAEIEAGRKLMELAEKSKKEEFKPETEVTVVVEKPPEEEQADELPEEEIEEEISEIPPKPTLELSPRDRELLEKEEMFFSKQEALPKTPLEIFGHNLFEQAPSTVAPITG